MKRMILTASLILFVAFMGCERDRDPLSGTMDTSANAVLKSADDGTGSITLTIELEDGTAVANAPITIHSKRISFDSVDIARELTTDESGRVQFDKLPAAKYWIRFEVLECPLSYELTLAEHQQLDQTYVIPSTFDLIVSVHVLNSAVAIGAWTYPLADTELLLEPGGYTGITGANASCRFENIPLNKYTLHMSRYGFEEKSQFQISFDPPGAEGYQYHYKWYFGAEDPVTEIVNSDEELMHNVFGPPLILRAVTRDLSRGLVDYSNAEWKSDLDGFLGYGTTYDVNGLTLGTHLITAFSGGVMYNIGGMPIMTDTDTATLHMYGYSDHSYFQLPYESSYRYAVEPETLIIEDDTGNDEVWSFSDWEVTSEQPGVFTGVITCDIETGATTKQGEYTATKWYGFDGNSILLSKTDELLTVTDPSAGTTEEVRIVAEYDPPLALLADYDDPGATPYRKQTSFGTVAWRYRDDRLVINRTEHTLHTVTFDTGPTQMIETPSGMIEALPVTMMDGDDTRTIYYAKGIGIVATESEPFGVPFRRALIEADIGESPIVSGAAGRAAWRSTTPARITTQAGSGASERLMTCRRILRNLSMP